MHAFRLSLKTFVPVFIFLSAQIESNSWSEHVHVRPESYALIDVMGDHVTDEGEVMFCSSSNLT